MKTASRRSVHGAVVVSAVLTVVGASVASMPVPVAAHSSGPAPDTAYYRTDLVGVTSPAPGLTASVDPHGDWIQVTYTGPTEVVILGYTREPYLRVTANSVDENVLSQATFLNQSMFAELPVAAQDSSGAPSWRRVAATGTARWHDHRIQWMGKTRPPEVAANPSRRHMIGTWVVHAITAGTPIEIRGTVSWLGRPRGLTGTVWLILAAANVPFFVAALVWHLRSRRVALAPSGRATGAG